MTEKDFDTRLKSALDDLEVPYDPATWDLLAQRLDAPPGSGGMPPVLPPTDFTASAQPANGTEAFDSLLRQNLDQLEAPYQPAHWNALSGRMDLIRQRTHRLWIAKAAELAIFLLLLLNLQNFFGAGFAPETPKKPVVKPNVPIAAAPHRKHSSGEMRNAAYDMSNASDGMQELDNRTGNAEFVVIGAEPGGQMKFLVARPIAEGNDVWMETTPLNVMTDPAAVVGIPALSPAFLSAESGAVFPYTHITIPVFKAHRFYLAGYAAVDRNRVVEPEQTRSFNGWSAGAAIGYRHNKWVLEAGLGYAGRQYAPKKQVEIFSGNSADGYDGSSLAQIEARVMTGSFKAGRQIARFGKTGVQAIAGVSINVAAQKNFNYRVTHYPGTAPSGSLIVNGQPQLQEEGRGVLEGGTLTRNVYASADLGLRVSRPIGRKLSAYVEPTWRQSLPNKGLGPKPARINTLSVQAGVLTML